MILGIDLGTVTGICYGAPADGLPQVDVWRLPKGSDDHGQFAAALADKLEGFLAAHRVDVIGYEKPLAVRPIKRGPVWTLNTSLPILRKLYGLAMVTELVAHRHDIGVAEANIATVKQALYGKGNASKTDMVQAAHSIGLQWPLNCLLSEREHVADAFGVWLKMARVFDQEAAKNFDPLFQAGKQKGLEL